VKTPVHLRGQGSWATVRVSLTGINFMLEIVRSKGS
jgi:hypothetical protein